MKVSRIMPLMAGVDISNRYNSHRAMPTTPRQIQMLIDSFAERDDDRFRTVALEIASAAAKAGDQKLAKSVRALVDRSRRSALPSVGPKAVPILRPEGELTTLLTVSYPKTRFVDMVLGGV